MESLYKRVLKFTILTLFQLLATPTSATAASTASKKCTEKCGNVTISYPFGIEDGCFRSGFQIICSEATSTATTVDGIGIKDISLSRAEMRLYNSISYMCNYPEGGKINTDDSYLALSDRRYRISHTRNKFTAVGCQTLAYVVTAPYSGSSLQIFLKDATGCLSACTNQSKFEDKSTCSGIGCCETAIPEGLSYYSIFFYNGLPNIDILDYSPCSFAFVAEVGFYTFLQSNTQNLSLYKRYNEVGAPVVIDWVLGNETCKEAKLNKSGNYGCVSSYSSCKESENGPGYTCNCSQGFEGNPYIHDGCKDINECKNQTLSQCYIGYCTNLQGSYNCSCPAGYYGIPHPKVQDDCRGIKNPIPIPLIVLIASLSTLLVAAIMFLMNGKRKLKKAKQKCFRQNERLLIQAQINAHQFVRFRIFSIKEIIKATNNFANASIKGRGGQGIVYEGIIDNRPVAIKKSIMIDEKRVKEFVKEMHILSLINHKNVLQILGYCLEVEVPILVYEFISGGTLYQRIQEKNQNMSLGYRLRIAIDSASALAYLHYDCFPPIIHGDVKSANILLDENNIAKISDFGASMLPLKDINEIGVPGTFGYLDPESLETGQLTKKSDVYSFAVVILELLTRMKAVYLDVSREKTNLAETFKEEGLEGILDEEIKYVVTREQIIEFSELLNNCLKNTGSERPTMKKVLAWLIRIQDFDPKLSEESEFYNIEPMPAESSYRTPYSTQFYSVGQRAVFRVDYNLTI